MNEELKFMILDVAGVEEPYFVLVYPINWKDFKKLQDFNSVLVELVNQGYLSCRREYNVPNLALKDLEQYVQERFAINDNNLGEPPSIYYEYHFAGTVKGKKWILEQGENSKVIGQSIIESLERYKNKKGRYPELLSYLCPAFLEYITKPHVEYGKWRYAVTMDGQSYKLELIDTSYDVAGLIYTPERQEWFYPK